MVSHRVKSIQLSEIGDFIKGHGTIKISDLTESGVPCIRYGEIYTTYGDVATNLKSCVSSQLADKCTPLLHGDIIFVASGETAEGIGKAVAWLGNGEAVVGSDIIILRNHGQNPAFLGYALNSYDAAKQKYRLGKGKSVVHIHTKELASLMIILPSLSEQKKIVDVLTCWDKAIVLMENLCSLKEKMLAQFQENIINSCCSNLGQDILGNFVSMPTKVKISHANGLKSLTVKLHCKGIEQNKRKTKIIVSKSGRPYYKRHAGEFLIGRQSFHSGGFGIVPKNLDGFIASNAITSLELDEGRLDPNFLFYYFSRKNYYLRLENIVYGTAQKEISDKQILNLPIYVPTLSKQKRITAVLSSGHSEILKLREQIKNFQLQKRGLIQKLLLGDSSTLG